MQFKYLQIFVIVVVQLWSGFIESEDRRSQILTVFLAVCASLVSLFLCWHSFHSN